METDPHRDSLIGVFLAEAVQGIARIAAALQPDEPADAALRDAGILAHTLHGSAALYGFDAIGELAGELESELERVPGRPSAERATALARLRRLAAEVRARLVAVERSREAVPGDPSPPPPAERLPDDYLLPELDAEVFSYFSPEAQEYLDQLEAALLRPDLQQAEAGTIQQLFRTAHTLKGSAYTVGFTAIGDLTHHVEDFLGEVREGRRRLTPDLADLIFCAVDVVRLLIRRDSRRLPEMRREFATVLERLRREAAGGPAAEPAGAAAPSAVAPVPAAPVAPTPVRDAAEGREPQAQAAAPAEPVEGAVIRVSRDRLERLLNLVGELVISRGRLEQRVKNLEQLSRQVLDCKERMLDSVRSFEEQHAFTMPEPAAAREGAGGGWLPDAAGFGGLEFDRYDDVNILARRMGEVSADVAEAMAQLNQSIRRAREDMGQLQQLSRSMRDEIARARMVPIGTPFTRFRRAVREMARATGKDVMLATSGERTEVDTGVVERLVDPLVHLVRNAVAHGIERPEVRAARGKPTTGTVYLHAAHRGNSVVVEVEDDGGGLDLDTIKAKAVALGLLRAEQAADLPEAEAVKLIFQPGFSTAEHVGDQAGRGMGMDVVKRAIEAMSGHIDIETEPGIGTKFTLTLPLTLLITAALSVRVASHRYAVPLSGIREVVHPAPGALQEVGGRLLLTVGEEPVEVRGLGRLLGIGDSMPPAGAPVVVARTSTGLAGLAVDELLGQQEIVIKPLGTLTLLREAPFAGATLDPEGRVVLVLDPAKLLAARRPQEALPAAGPSALVTGETVTAAAAGEGARRLLLIDDSLSVRKFVGRMLEQAGYTVDTAVDGEDGLRRASERAYALIITDLEMPKLNGYEVIQALRQRPRTAATPILVMTTRAAEKHRQMAVGMGASGYVTKPVEERALLQEVARRIGAAAGGAAPAAGGSTPP